MLRTHPRYLSARLREALADTPAVLIHGPRQSGKTTLARTVGKRRGYRYFSFDDEALRGAARQDPAGFVAGLPARVILDEVQRVTDLAAPFQLTRQTIHDHVTILERVFLVERLPPWHRNRMSRLVKSPKLHVGDTGVACALLGLDARTLHADREALGPMLETFVLQELKRQASWRTLPIGFHHFRNRDGFEVDIVMEQGAGKVAGVEVKAAAPVSWADFRGLRKLKEAAGEHFAGGVVLYDGEVSASFGDGMHAVPVRTLWEVP